MTGRWQGGAQRLARFPPDWKARRRAVLERDGRICQLCGRPGADTVDHIDDPDDHRLENLRAVHDRRPPHCHRFRSSAQGSAARTAKAVSERRPREAHPGLRG